MQICYKFVLFVAGDFGILDFKIFILHFFTVNYVNLLH